MGSMCRHNMPLSRAQPILVTVQHSRHTSQSSTSFSQHSSSCKDNEHVELVRTGSQGPMDPMFDRTCTFHPDRIYGKISAMAKVLSKRCPRTVPSRDTDPDICTDANVDDGLHQLMAKYPPCTSTWVTVESWTQEPDSSREGLGNSSTGHCVCPGLCLGLFPLVLPPKEATASSSSALFGSSKTGILSPIPFDDNLSKCNFGGWVICTNFSRPASTKTRQGEVCRTKPVLGFRKPDSACQVKSLCKLSCTHAN